MTLEEEIKNAVKNPYAQMVINEQDFYFQKGQDALKKWLNLSVNDNLKIELLNLADKYEEIQKRATQNDELKKILELLFEIISYCDSKAKDKLLYNQYDDKRTLAMAYVRMNHWIEKLILYKFDKSKISNGSTLNAFNYLLDPKNNSTILSENHREMISTKLFKKNYNSNEFNNDLKEYFFQYSFSCVNINNYTYLLSCIIYTIKREWLDDIIGLMAADSTRWQDELIAEMGDDDCGIIWNSSKPTGTTKTLKMLRTRINDDGYFKIFYSVRGYVTYVAEIIDFVINDNELKQKKWKSNFNLVHWLDSNNFEDYKDANKSAKIIYLAKRFYEIEPILATEFEVYQNYSYPRQDNFTPIVSEPDSTIIPPTIISIDYKMKDENNNNKYPSNQILFGPPGTGKTYKLQQIIQEWDLKEKIGSTKDYTSFVKDYTWWKIIALALLDSGKITVPDLAKHPLISAKLGSSNVKSLKTRLWSSLQHHCVDDCENVKLVKRIGEKVFYKEANNSEWRLDDSEAFQSEYTALIDAYKEFKASDNTKSKDYTFTTCHQSLTYEDFIEGIKPDLNKSDDDEIQGKDVIYEIRKGVFYNACEKAAQKAGFVNLKDCLDKTKEERKELFDKAIEEGKIHVIFLDEINRCNVSSVFGELITLIEEDKRLGRENEIADITLPYSQDDFGVPANLFIIGTMNTADRSVEALDTALRRRFSFEEMPPLYDLKELDYSISEYKATDILKTINTRIEKLINKDHAIGHSYFLSKDNESIVESFYKNIIPLLQEYFFGDYGKIGLILGKGFIKLKEYEKETTVFADFDTDTANDFDDRNVYEIIDYRTVKDYKLKVNKTVLDMNFEKAIQVLMNKKFE